MRLQWQQKKAGVEFRFTGGMCDGDMLGGTEGDTTTQHAVRVIEVWMVKGMNRQLRYATWVWTDA